MIKILLSRKLGELRVTQADLARRTGIRPTTINEMYHELCERVNLEHLDLICEALDCDLGEIIERIPRISLSTVCVNCANTSSGVSSKKERHPSCSSPRLNAIRRGLLLLIVNCWIVFGRTAQLDW